MDLILNELSVKGLSPNPVELREAVEKVIAMRNAADIAGVKVYCPRNLSNMAVSSGEAFRAILQVLPHEKKRAMFRWMDKHGPFWEETQLHSADEWYECDGEFVTEKGLAEAAYCVENGIDRRTLSFASSDWKRPQITVTHRENDAASRDISVLNYWDMSELEPALIKAEPTPKSWKELEDAVRRRFTNINFTADSFGDLDGLTFAPGMPVKILRLLNALDKFWAVGGRASDEGRRIYEDHFMGKKKKPWFSDSSATEKRMFKRNLTFRLDGNDVFCPWHGKWRIGNDQFRIHFTWPVPRGGQLHVVYFGCKITKRTGR